MNGYTPSTPVRKQIANLTEQIPAIHRTNVLAIAITDSGNEYDFCRRLTGLVLGKVWTSFGEHAICEADDLEVVENTTDPRTANLYDFTPIPHDMPVIDFEKIEEIPFPTAITPNSDEQNLMV